MNTDLKLIIGSASSSTSSPSSSHPDSITTLRLPCEPHSTTRLPCEPRHTQQPSSTSTLPHPILKKSTYPGQERNSTLPLSRCHGDTKPPPPIRKTRISVPDGPADYRKFPLNSSTISSISPSPRHVTNCDKSASSSVESELSIVHNRKNHIAGPRRNNRGVTEV